MASCDSTHDPAPSCLLSVICSFWWYGPLYSFTLTGVCALTISVELFSRAMGSFGPNARCRGPLSTRSQGSLTRNGLSFFLVASWTSPPPLGPLTVFWRGALGALILLGGPAPRRCPVLTALSTECLWVLNSARVISRLVIFHCSVLHT